MSEHDHLRKVGARPLGLLVGRAAAGSNVLPRLIENFLQLSEQFPLEERLRAWWSRAHVATAFNGCLVPYPARLSYSKSCGVSMTNLLFFPLVGTTRIFGTFHWV